ncbi:hypothetical protein IW262DRAFT_1011486 [Armillaria fumosa]|nr:hypothetical protein IW262DRAFT_1011486 [Armillaria fumosa]
MATNHPPPAGPPPNYQGGYYPQGYQPQHQYAPQPPPQTVIVTQQDRRSDDGCMGVCLACLSGMACFCCLDALIGSRLETLIVHTCVRWSSVISRGSEADSCVSDSPNQRKPYTPRPDAEIYDVSPLMPTTVLSCPSICLETEDNI